MSRKLNRLSTIQPNTTPKATLPESRQKFLKLLRNQSKPNSDTNVDLSDVINPNHHSPSDTQHQEPILNRHPIDTTQTYTACILITVFAIVFIGLIVFIAYDLTIHHETLSLEIASIKNPPLSGGSKPNSPKDNNRLSSVAKRKQIHNKMLVKIIQADELWDHYEHVNYTIDKSRVNLKQKILMGYNAYDMDNDFFRNTIDDKCEPIISSITASCCCFFEKMDRLMCDNDEPIEFSSPSTEGLIDIKLYQITCELLYSKKMVNSNSIQYHTPILYLGLSLDYVNQTAPQYFEGFVVDNHSECTLKITFVCLTMN